MDDFIEVKGIKTAYRITGPEDENAPVAVILQGWGTSYGLYDIVAETINDRYRVVQFDMPGFGATPEPAEAWDVPGYADYFLEFLSKLGIGSVMLIGHSYGGRVIIELASKKSLPIDITGIVLIDSAGVLPVRTPAQKRKTAVYKILKKLFDNRIIYFLFDEIIDDWKSRQGSEDYRRATPLMRQTLVKSVNYDQTSLLSLIDSDVLLIWGDKDTATPIRDAHIMEREIPRSGLAVIPGTGHFSFAENPGLFMQILNSYLDEAAEGRDANV